MLLYLLLFLELRVAVTAVDNSVCSLRICNCTDIGGPLGGDRKGLAAESGDTDHEDEYGDVDDGREKEINVYCECTRRTKILSLGRTPGKSVIPEGVNDLFIHNCLSVTLSTGAFGVRAAQRVHIKDVFTVNVEKWAFRRDRISMRLIKLENIENMIVHSEAFTGIHDENNIHFQNVTWKYARTRTFSNITDIKQLTFSSVRIGEIGPHALWKVENIQSFTFNGSHSQREACLIEKINSYALSFSGKRVNIEQCKFGVIRSDAFHVTSDADVKITHNVFDVVEPYSLGFVFSRYTFRKNEVKMLGPNAFSKLNGRKSGNASVTFSLVGNTFRNVTPSSLDIGDETSVESFHILDNAFDCKCKNLSWFHTLHKNSQYGGFSKYYELMLDESVCAEHHNELVVAYREVGDCNVAKEVTNGNPFLDLDPLLVIPASITAFLLLLCVCCRCCLKSKCSRPSGEFV